MLTTLIQVLGLYGVKSGQIEKITPPYEVKKKILFEVKVVLFFRFGHFLLKKLERLKLPNFGARLLPKQNFPQFFLKLPLNIHMRRP